MSLSREQLEQSFKGKSHVELEDLVQLIEEKFGYSVTLKKKNERSDEQKNRMTEMIFKDEGVLYQLHQAQKDRESGISTYSDDEEEFAKLLSEVHDE